MESIFQFRGAFFLLIHFDFLDLFKNFSASGYTFTFLIKM